MAHFHSTRVSAKNSMLLYWRNRQLHRERHPRSGQPAGRALHRAAEEYSRVRAVVPEEAQLDRVQAQVRGKRSSLDSLDQSSVRS